MKKDSMSPVNELTEIVKFHFDNDEGLIYSRNIFISAFVSFYRCPCSLFLLDEGQLRETVADYLKDLFLEAIISDGDDSLKFFSDLFDSVCGLIDFNALSRFYVEEALAKAE